MTSFAVTGNVGAQVLVAGETGYVSQSGAIYPASQLDAAITGTGAGTINLAILGSVTSVTDTMVISSSQAVITIGATGSVMSSGILADAISLTDTGLVFIQNAGLIAGGNGIRDELSGVGVLDFQLVNSGTVTTTGASYGAVLVTAAFGQAVITNSGTISSSGFTAISCGGAANLTISNSGSIVSSSLSNAAILANSMLNLANSGQIIGQIFAQNMSVVNTGDILGGMIGSAGGTTIFNSGHISGTVITGVDSDLITNSGIMSATLRGGDGADTIYNSGWIGGELYGDEGNDVFYLSHGHVDGGVYGGLGNDTFFVDEATYLIYDFEGGYDRVVSSVSYRLTNGIEELSLSGPGNLLGIGGLDDNVILGDVGNDTLRGLSGNDVMNGGMGNNLLQGGIGNDSLGGGNENDTLMGGAGDDQFYMSYGDDAYFGGTGNDMLLLIADTVPLVVNLETGVMINAESAINTVAGIENVQGTSNADAITGNAQNNRLLGLGGIDTITGGSGNDTITGGLGADSLTGGLGADTFVYTVKGDSSNAVRDRIVGFDLIGDVIDLGLIDANAGVVDDQAFTYLGTGTFTGTIGEVRIVLDAVAHTTSIQVRLAGSVANDMVIVLATDLMLTSANFIL